MKAMTGSLCSVCLVAGMAMVLSSCTKDAFDLRSQYIGPYSFTVETHGAHGVGQDWLITDTSYTDAGAVLNGSQSGILEVIAPAWTYKQCCTNMRASPATTTMDQGASPPPEALTTPTASSPLPAVRASTLPATSSSTALKRVPRPHSSPIPRSLPLQLPCCKAWYNNGNSFDRICYFFVNIRNDNRFVTYTGNTSEA